MKHLNQILTLVSQKKHGMIVASVLGIALVLFLWITWISDSDSLTAQDIQYRSCVKLLQHSSLNSTPEEIRPLFDDCSAFSLWLKGVQPEDNGDKMIPSGDGFYRVNNNLESRILTALDKLAETNPDWVIMDITTDTDANSGT